MKSDFSFWKTRYDSETLDLFNNDSAGQLWLKTKSVVRKELISEFVSKYSITLSSTALKEQFKELFNILSHDIQKSHRMLDNYMREKNISLLKSLKREKLVSELYKLKVFEWGGDYQNSLDKYLVTHYVKAISSYDLLMSKFEKEINCAVQGYVLNSWYNHWTSILIEHIFKSHKSVLPTVGQIKSVDFFINNIPFDLKVTYFPSEYMKLKRKEKGLPVELTYLKSKAKELQLSFDKSGSASDIYYEISEKLKDKGDKSSSKVLSEIKQSNMQIVKEAQANPKMLAQWLYENQGEMRFGSENRLFLVLIDTDDFSSSWKLKRNLNLLTPTINNFLDTFQKKTPSSLEIKFNYKEKPQIYNSLADIIFVVK
ncbi:MAG: hypothetical protein LHV68_10755 [Elusimicrobia bacterium]|nr:hypothetical protein [Candidatus Liberimonas magnetica]